MGGVITNTVQDRGGTLPRSSVVPPLLESVFESCLCLGFYVCALEIGFLNSLFVYIFDRLETLLVRARARKGETGEPKEGVGGERHAVRASPGLADILFNPCLELDECSY